MGSLEHRHRCWTCDSTKPHSNWAASKSTFAHDILRLGVFCVVLAKHETWHFNVDWTRMCQKWSLWKPKSGFGLCASRDPEAKMRGRYASTPNIRHYYHSLISIGGWLPGRLTTLNIGAAFKQNWSYHADWLISFKLICLISKTPQ